MNEYTTLFERTGARFEDPTLQLAGVLRSRDRRRQKRRIAAALVAGIIVGLVGGAGITSYLRSASESRPAGRDVPLRNPVVSPDGSHIASVGPGGIWVSDAEGSGAVRVAPGYEFAWSPDGTRIATHAESLLGPHGPWHEEIWVVSADGSDPVSILRSDCCPKRIVDQTLRWSPDGTRVAFSYAADPQGNFRVALTNGSDARRSLGDLPSIEWIEWRNSWR